MDGSDVGELIAEFNATKTLRTDVAKPVWHNSLRLPKNEALTDAQWSGIADDYMSRMGFSETHLRCYVLHDDAAGQHIHIIASRIDLSNRSLYLGKMKPHQHPYHPTVRNRSPSDQNQRARIGSITIPSFAIQKIPAPKPIIAIPKPKSYRVTKR